MSAIDDKYHALGGPGGFLSHPHDAGVGSHEMETRTGRGRFREFQGGSVSWIPDGRIDVRQRIDQGMRCAQPRRAP